MNTAELTNFLQSLQGLIVLWDAGAQVCSRASLEDGQVRVQPVGDDDDEDHGFLFPATNPTKEGAGVTFDVPGTFLVSLYPLHSSINPLVRAAAEQVPGGVAA